MIDWAFLGTWFMGLLQGIISGAIGGIILIWFILPKMGAKTATHTLKAMKKDPEIAPMILKAQEILKTIEPLAKQLKNVDIDKLKNEIQPFFETAKRIDPKTVEELLSALKNLAEGFKKRIEDKPKIPMPD